MIVTRPTFATPVIVIDDFMSERVAGMLFSEWLSLKPLYNQATVFDDEMKIAVRPERRTNEIVELEDVSPATRNVRSITLTLLKDKMWSEECRRLWHEGYSIFDIINYSTKHEGLVSRYADGAYYRLHQDVRFDFIYNRLVTFVYYLNTTPQQFTGGELVLWENDVSLRIEPKRDRVVVFPSWVGHEVLPVKMASEEWSDARFSLNYWVGFKG